MQTDIETDVLIAGAGPTGLTLAVDLGKRGVRCTLIEQKDAPQFLPKMERCNARTMEIYRRMGLAGIIRAAALPADCPMDVFIVFTVVEPPLLHLPYPSVNEARKEIAARNDGTLPLEPYQLVSQYTLEPLLKAEAEKLPSVDVRFGHELVEFTQDPQSVTATVRTSAGEMKTIKAKYMVGCDGGASVVRKQLGIKLQGEGNLLQLRQALYYCEDLYERIPIGKGRHYHVADNQASFLIVQDSTKHFTLHAVVENDADMATQFEKVVAMPVKYEMLYVGQWKQNLLLADRYTENRVFMAGDAVHLVIPTGGLGMNTGVGDAVDLSWKLAATLQGWGGPGLLASYETERRKVGGDNVGASTYASRGRRLWRSQWKPDIRDNTPEGHATRDNLARVADIEQRKTNEMLGAEFGYHYAHSPLIAQEDGDPPPYDYREYTPSTHPGCRLPHVWLDDGTPIQDRIAHDSAYVLLRLGKGGADDGALGKAFAAIGAPFTALDIPDAGARALYGCNLILLRPDMHIVWRGDAPPANAVALARMATGH
jgi:2-polyprenyl-6-methoxyphenol hydroxylase-like FAD-dependent oxidoreductase